MEGHDAVFLAGAHYPRYSTDLDGSVEIGLTGVRNAFDAALDASVPRLVFTSTIAALDGPADRHLTEDDFPAQMPSGSVYRAVKWAMEREAERAAERGLEIVSVLPGGCLGPWDARVGTASVIVGTVLGRIPWYLDGTVNMVDVGDVAKAHVRAAERGRSGDRFIMGGHALTMGALLSLIARRYGGTVPSESVNAEEARARADADEQRAAPNRERVPFPREMVDIVSWNRAVSSDRARRELSIELTPIDRALDRAHEWLSRFGYLKPRPDTSEQSCKQAKRPEPAFSH
jgi:dihydroflavonol-4-reductase